jgi:hypothetical protein
VRAATSLRFTAAPHPPTHPLTHARLAPSLLLLARHLRRVQGVQRVSGPPPSPARIQGMTPQPRPTAPRPQLVPGIGCTAHPPLLVKGHPSLLPTPSLCLARLCAPNPQAAHHRRRRQEVKSCTARGRPQRAAPRRAAGACRGRGGAGGSAAVMRAQRRGSAGRRQPHSCGSRRLRPPPAAPRRRRPHGLWARPAPWLKIVSGPCFGPWPLPRPHARALLPAAAARRGRRRAPPRPAAARLNRAPPLGARARASRQQGRRSHGGGAFVP